MTRLIKPMMYAVGYICMISFFGSFANAEKAEISLDKVSVEEVVEEKAERPKMMQIPSHTHIYRKGNDDFYLKTVVSPEEVVEVAEEEVVTPLYAVGNEMLDEEIQTALYNELSHYGIEYLFPYSIMQIYQECSFDYHQVTHQRNGANDIGLFQFRDLYWEEHCERNGIHGDIYDPFVQIKVYASDMARRLLIYGDSIVEAICKHYTSDWCPYYQPYIDDVFSHQGKLRKVR